MLYENLHDYRKFCICGIPGTNRHLQCVSVDGLVDLGGNGACCVRLQVNVGKGREVMIAFACCQQAVESFAPAQAYADVGVLVGNVLFLTQGSCIGLWMPGVKR